MKSFEHGGRIKISAKDHPMYETHGTVARLRFADEWAWVNMDCEPAKSLEAFPEGDSWHRHILLNPEDCEK